MQVFNSYSSFFIALLICATLLACNSSKKTKRVNTNCIKTIIKQDDSLGTIRNQKCETISLSETIKQYTFGLANLNFSDCPDEFSEAFKTHIAAWNAMILITDKHGTLRGEMHDLFDIIEVSDDSVQFRILLKDIWDTWAGIENVMKSH